MLAPEQIAAPGNEHSHQAAVFQWVATVGAVRWPHMRRLFAVPNGANYGGDRKTGARMRAEGLRSGVPDMCWPMPVHGWPGLWIELKRPGLEKPIQGHDSREWGRSAEQIDWTRWLAGQGWAVVVACGWRPACAALITYARQRPVGEQSRDRDPGVMLYAGDYNLEEMMR